MSSKKKPRRLFLKFCLILCYVALFAVIFVIGAGLAVLNACSKDLPNVDLLAKFEPSETSRIYSADGVLIGTLFKENRYWVPIDEIPQSMQDAIVAIEDSRFYTHHGVDFKSVGRAVILALRGGEASQGASTITMQLSREIFLNQEKTMHRKIQEVIIAMQIERRFTKREILERYLNQIYFGAGAYGIEAASQTYFGKKTKDLDLAQSALIAGLPPAPSVYSPFEDEESAVIRQHLVIDRMLESGYISEAQAREAKEEKLVYAKPKTEMQQLKYPYFTSYVMKQLSQKYNDDLLYRGGLKIYTTVDLKMQRIAEDAVKKGIAKAAAQNMNATNGALVAIDPSNGYIKAMAGGTNYTDKNQFNRAWQARRQPGSSFKTIIYTAAVDTGYTPDYPISDTAVSYKMGDGTLWTPNNSDRRFMGTMTLRDSLKWSRNICAVRLLEMVGVDNVIDYASRMGITEPLEPHLSIALGSGVTTPLEMAAAYSVLASGGLRYEPTAIKVIFDSSGNPIEDHRWPQAKEVIAESTAFTMSEMLRLVIESGTGTTANIGRPAAGKTGTTDEFRDAWFVGYVPQLSVAVWTGNDNNSRMNHVYGGDLPAPMWADFMKRALVDVKKLEFGADDKGMVNVSLCSETELRATGTCPNIIKRKYKAGSVPQRFCNRHGPVKYNKKTGRIERLSPEEMKLKAKPTEAPRRPEGAPRPADVEPEPETEVQGGAVVERPKAIPIPKPPELTEPPKVIEIPEVTTETTGGTVIEIPPVIDDSAPNADVDL